MKEKHFLIADTETVGLGSRALVFDFGYVIATRKRIIKERTFLIREIITNPKVMLFALMDEYWRQSFGGKIFHHYIPKLNSSQLKIHPWNEVCEILRDDMRTHGIDVFTAYNLRFDMGALGRTQDYIQSGGKVLDYKPDLLCLWQFACETVCQSKLYHDIARQQGAECGWITPADNIRTNAEKVYSFLTGDLTFIESHTALEDAQIETEILQRLLARKSKIPYNVLSHMPWRLAQRLHGHTPNRRSRK